MPIICPAILASDPEKYRQQIEKIAHFAHRIQIDLTDHIFAVHPTIKPEEAWWPAGFKADFHLMYKDPAPAVNAIIKHRPNLIIVHAEAEGNFIELSEFLRRRGVKAGVALLQATPAESILPALPHIDHVLIFSGQLGQFGGQADLRQVEKAKFLRQHKPELEIGWDGGVNEQNISELVFGGVDVLNVGGFIQRADNPGQAFARLARIAEETGTT